MHIPKLTFALASILAVAVKAAATEVAAHETVGVNLSERAPIVTCGQYYKIEEGAMPLYANGHYENLDVATHMVGIENVSCGICMIFAGRDAQGDILWSGGPGQSGGSQARGAKSYYCISDSPAPAAIKSVKNVGVTARDTACGAYFDDRQEGPIDLLADGHYENVEKDTNMWSIENVSCGICMVFAGRDAQGAIKWSGGPGQGTALKVKGSQSYYCIYGELPVVAGTQAPTVAARDAIDARDTAGR